MADPQEMTQENESTQTNAPENENPTGSTAPDDTPPVKRRRGRPPKNPDAAMQKENVSSDGAPKRGRPAKSAKKQYTPDDISVLGRQIVGIHMMVAQITQIPEAQLSDPEGQMMAQSIINMADQYDLALDGKTGAALQLFATAAMIYAPRAIAFKQRMKSQQRATAPAPETVTPV